jgi:hypothetical protein
MVRTIYFVCEIIIIRWMKKTILNFTDLMFLKCLIKGIIRIMWKRSFVFNKNKKKSFSLKNGNGDL